MTEKAIALDQQCPVCKGPSHVQVDKGGKLFTMCDGRHPENGGCGARIYFGQRNSATMKANAARKPNVGKSANQNTPEAANQNKPETRGGGSGFGSLGEW